jgi:hypothetical protein
MILKRLEVEVGGCLRHPPGGTRTPYKIRGDYVEKNTD